MILAACRYQGSNLESARWPRTDDNGAVAGRQLTDQITLAVLAASVPRDAMNDAVESAGKQARRPAASCLRK